MQSTLDAAVRQADEASRMQEEAQQAEMQAVDLGNQESRLAAEAREAERKCVCYQGCRLASHVLMTGIARTASHVLACVELCGAISFDMGAAILLSGHVQASAALKGGNGCGIGSGTFLALQHACTTWYVPLCHTMYNREQTCLLRGTWVKVHACQKAVR